MPIPGIGTFAMLQDPDGVMIGLFEEKMPASATMTGRTPTHQVEADGDG
jgi:hypothetical protein